MRRLPLVLFACLLLLTGCGGSSSKSSASGTVTIGTKNFPEEFILGQLYKQALEAKGFTVRYKENIGSTELIQTSLTSGRIDMYPEYTGVVVQDVFGHALSAKTADATFQLAKQLEEKHGFTLLDATPFSDTDAIAVLKQTAAKDGLHALGDLKKVPGLKLGGQPEFRTRNTGLVGLRRNYGLHDVSFVPFAGISPYVALDSHQVDAAAVFSTDPPLGKNSKYVTLADPVHQFGFQNAAPIVKQAVVDKLGPDFTDTVNAVSAKLSQDAIVAMNKAVIVNKQKPASVARQFLQANGLL
jgi:osmoprotectant transport system substrate-binding protein